MRHLIIASILCLIFSAQASAEPTYSLTAKAVDEQGEAIDIEMLRCFQTAAPQKKHYLSCMNDDCSEWQISEPVSETVTIQATASKQSQTEPECDDIYMGELTLDQNSYNSESNVIVMKVTDMVCP